MSPGSAAAIGTSAPAAALADHLKPVPPGPPGTVNMPDFLNTTCIALDEFVLGGNSPLSYTQVRRMCERIQKGTGFTEKITPKRFRTTVLTDLYDKTRDIKLVQAAAGHTTAEMTLKHYVKGRGNVVKSAAAIESAYTA